MVALIDTLIPVFIGRPVALMESADRAAALHAALPQLLGMAALVLVGRPLRCSPTAWCATTPSCPA